MTIKDFLELRDLIRIENHEPGQIKFKLSPKIIMHSSAKALTDAARKYTPGQKDGLLEKTGVKTWKFDLFSRSLDVDYDPTFIEPGILNEFFQTGNETRAGELVEKVAAMFGVTLEE